MVKKTVVGYIEGLEGWQAQLVTKVRSLVIKTAPNAKESIKWAQPVYEANGPFCYIKAFKNSVNFGFWRGIDLDDPKGILQGSGDKMRHIKLKGINDIDEEQFTKFVSQAVELNETKGDPTKRK